MHITQERIIEPALTVESYTPEQLRDIVSKARALEQIARESANNKEDDGEHLFSRNRTATIDTIKEYWEPTDASGNLLYPSLSIALMSVGTHTPQLMTFRMESLDDFYERYQTSSKGATKDGKEKLRKLFDVQVSQRLTLNEMRLPTFGTPLEYAIIARYIHSYGSSPREEYLAKNASFIDDIEQRHKQMPQEKFDVTETLSGSNLLSLEKLNSINREKYSEDYAPQEIAVITVERALDSRAIDYKDIWGFSNNATRLVRVNFDNPLYLTPLEVAGLNARERL